MYLSHSRLVCSRHFSPSPWQKRIPVLVLQVDAHGDRLVINDNASAVLRVCRLLTSAVTEVKFLCGHLQIAPDDGGRHGKHLLRLRVYLHECLAVASVRGLYIHDDSLAVE